MQHNYLEEQQASLDNRPQYIFVPLIFEFQSNLLESSYTHKIMIHQLRQQSSLSLDNRQ